MLGLESKLPNLKTQTSRVLESGHPLLFDSTKPFYQVLLVEYTSPIVLGMSKLQLPEVEPSQIGELRQQYEEATSSGAGKESAQACLRYSFINLDLTDGLY